MQEDYLTELLEIVQTCIIRRTDKGKIYRHNILEQRGELDMQASDVSIMLSELVDSGLLTKHTDNELVYYRFNKEVFKK